jgi:RNA polymerase sigma-70 factor (ECF subfamily)
MNMDLRERGQWLARNVLPHEGLLRAKLRAIRTYGLEVEDIIQETYTRILSVQSLESITYPKQYALLTAKAIIVDHIRHSRVVSIASGGKLESLDVPEPTANAEELLEIHEEVLAVTDALAQIPKLSREILIMRRVERISQKDVARRLGISEKTVEKHMARGARHLVKLFGRGGKTNFRTSNKSPSDRFEEERSDHADDL